MTMMEQADFNKKCVTLYITDINLRAVGPQTFKEVCLEGREQGLFQN